MTTAFLTISVIQNIFVQEDLEQFQEFERLFQSLETQLQQWESKQRIDSKLTDISQVINTHMHNSHDFIEEIPINCFCISLFTVRSDGDQFSLSWPGSDKHTQLQADSQWPHDTEASAPQQEVGTGLHTCSGEMQVTGAYNLIPWERF